VVLLTAPRTSAQLGSLVVNITSPQNGATVSGTTPVTASVTIVGLLTVARVEFYRDGVFIGLDTSAPYSINWNTAATSNGPHTLTAVGRTTLGVGFGSPAVSVTVFNDLTPPTVSMTAPAAGATVRGSIAVTANASDNVAVAGVQFKLDGANLGAEDTSAPYSVTWNTAAASNGAHSLTAVARDAGGNTVTATAVSVTVDNSAPTVSISSPAAGGTVTQSITVSATASDNSAVAGVKFFVDGAQLGAEDVTAPYEATWNTASGSDGLHSLTAVARDPAGNVATSASVSVTVDNTAPVVAVTSPAGGATVSASITVTANATDSVGVAGVQFLVDGAPLGAEKTVAPYSVDWDTTTASDGGHAITARARDGAGNTTTSAAVAVTVANSTGSTTRIEDSSAAIAYTPDGSWLLGYTDSRPWSGGTTALGFSLGQRATLNFTGTGVSWIGFKGPQTGIATVHLDGALVATIDAYSATEAVGVAMFTATGLVNGPHTIAIEVTRTKNEASSDFFVAIDAFDVMSNGGGVPTDTTPPAVGISSPADGATVSGTTVITATATDNVGVVGVRFLVDGVQLGVEDTAAPYEASWNTAAAANGAHTLTAVARDAAGNSTTSNAVAVTVNNTVDTAPPAVTITAPASNATVSGTITVAATASDDVGVAGVRFFVDGAQIGAEDTAAPYEAAWNTPATANGTHTVTAIARDAAGNTTTSAGVTVTVSNTASGEITRTEDSSTAITYEGTWAQGNMSRPWSGGTAAIAALTGTVARATFAFNGQGISWIGFRGPNTGIANVYLDGALVATVDAYAAAEQLQAVMFTAQGLPFTTHTIIVESTGTKNAASADSFVVVDAFDVTGEPPPPDTTAPSVTITWPGAGAAVWGTTPIAAVASDSHGVEGVRFLVDGVQIGAEDTIAPYAVTWDSRLVGDGPHTLTATARDAAGNSATSAAVAIVVTNAAPPAMQATTRVEDTSPRIVFQPGIPAPGQPDAWFHGSRSRDWSNGTSTFNRSKSARASIAFTGTGITWVGFRGFWTGIARVYLDDVFVAEIDLFLPQCTPEQRAQGCIDEDDQAPVFTARGLAAGPHTLTVEVTGDKHPNATDNAVVVDGFDIMPASPPDVTGTRIEETASAMSFTGAWSQNDTSGAWSGGTAAVSATTGARATVTAVGTEIRWVGRRGPNAGIARIFLDGSLQAEIDQHFQSEVQGVMYVATGLVPGTHTMAVEVTGLKNAASSGTAVFVDAFDVRSRFEERDSAVTYAGTWQHEHMDKDYSGGSPNVGGGTASRSATAGASAEFTFTGSAIQFIGWRGPAAGIADISLDGVPVERVDLYAATDQMRATVFSATGLGSGSHTLRIDVTGLRNPASANSWVAIDAFDVVLPLPQPVITRVQQTDASVTYTTPPDTAGWSTSSANKYFSGRTVTASSTTGARATFSFTGTDIRIIGQRRRDSGIARIYVDGVLAGDVDTFSPVQDEFQAAIFAAGGLAPSVTHTVTIEVTGTKRGDAACTTPPACSAGVMIVLDAFEVYQR
jgi:hypothetical protein